MCQQFKYGDYVRVTEPFGWVKPEMVGVVKDIISNKLHQGDQRQIGVEFKTEDAQCRGHDFKGNIIGKSGYYIISNYLEKVTDIKQLVEQAKYELEQAQLEYKQQTAKLNEVISVKKEIYDKLTKRMNEPLENFSRAISKSSTSCNLFWRNSKKKIGSW